MGQVWRAEHTSLGTTVAVKLVDLASTANPEETMARFLHEARAAASMKNPNVVQTIDHGSQGHFVYIVMELLEGESLAKRLGRVGVLQPPDIVRIFREMARALEKAHAQGIVHRDIKPENVFIALEDGREITKLLDFGIAKTNEGGENPHLKTHAGTVMGTPAYMSPEQVLGKPLDTRSDLWQLAMIAFECVTGVRAFSGNTLGELFMRICTAPLPVPSQVVRQVPVGFDAWFARAAQRNPKDRFQSARELSESLASVLLRSSASGPMTVPFGALGANDPGRLPTGQNETWSSPPQGSSQTRRALTMALVVLPILVIGAVGAVWIVKGGDDGKPNVSSSAISPPSAIVSPAATPSPVVTTMPTMDVVDAGPSPASSAPDAGKPTKLGGLKQDKNDLGF